VVLIFAVLSRFEFSSKIGQKNPHKIKPENKGGHAKWCPVLYAVWNCYHICVCVFVHVYVHIRVYNSCQLRAID